LSRSRSGRSSRIGQEPPVQERQINTSVFSLSNFNSSNLGVFSATSLGDALSRPDSGGVGAAATAGDGTLRFATADSFQPGDVAFLLAGSQAALAQTETSRPKAVSYSDAYTVRRKIHMYASFATVPLFVAQTVVGQELYNAPLGIVRGRTRLWRASPFFRREHRHRVWNLAERKDQWPPSAGPRSDVSPCRFLWRQAPSPQEEGYGMSSGSGRSPSNCGPRLDGDDRRLVHIDCRDGDHVPSDQHHGMVVVFATSSA
jgi:hypothetical protein